MIAATDRSRAASADAITVNPTVPPMTPAASNPQSVACVTTEQNHPTG